MKKMRGFLALLPALLLLAACGLAGPAGPGPDDPVSSDDTPVPAEEPSGEEMLREENAIVEEIDILLMESFPLQVSVQVKGQLRDGCTKVAETWAEKVDEHTFAVHILTERPKEAMCTEALQPFEVSVPLEVYGLPAGEYTVKVYDLESSFTFEQDNALPE